MNKLGLHVQGKSLINYCSYRAETCRLLYCTCKHYGKRCSIASIISPRPCVKCAHVNEDRGVHACFFFLLLQLFIFNLQSVWNSFIKVHSLSFLSVMQQTAQKPMASQLLNATSFSVEHPVHNEQHKIQQWK